MVWKEEKDHVALLDLEMVRREYARDEEKAQSGIKKLIAHKVALIFLSDEPRTTQLQQWLEERGFDQYECVYQETRTKGWLTRKDWKQLYVRDFLYGLDIGAITPDIQTIYVAMGGKKIRAGLEKLHNHRITLYSSLEELASQSLIPSTCNRQRHTLIILDFNIIDEEYQKNRDAVFNIIKELYRDDVEFLVLEEKHEPGMRQQWLKEGDIYREKYHCYTKPTTNRSDYRTWRLTTIQTRREQMYQKPGMREIPIDRILIFDQDEKNRQAIEALGDSRVSIFDSLNDLHKAATTPRPRTIKVPTAQPGASL